MGTTAAAGEVSPTAAAEAMSAAVEAATTTVTVGSTADVATAAVAATVHDRGRPAAHAWPGERTLVSG